MISDAVDTQKADLSRYNLHERLVKPAKNFVYIFEVTQHNDCF